MANAKPLRYMGVGYSDMRLDPVTRRWERVSPVAKLRLVSDGPNARLREVPLSRAELVKLIRDASATLARMEGLPRDP